MIRITGQSDWSFKTSSSQGVATPGLISLSLGRGKLYLNDPRGAEWHFNYNTVGVGAGLGLMVASASTTDNYSVGQILLLDAFQGGDLSTDDFEGFCTVQDLTMAARGGISWTVMFIGLEAKDLAEEVAIDGFSLSLVGMLLDKIRDKAGFDWPKIISSSAKAVLIMEGTMQGAGAAIGITNSVGRLSKTGSVVEAVTRGAQRARG